MMKYTRKAFLRLSAAAGAPALLPPSAFGAAGQTAPSGRIAVGLIGMGKMMFGHLRNCLNREDVHVVALCDVERNRLKVCGDLVAETYSKRFGSDYKGVAVHRDFRELVARSDLDAVLIATPTNWHALQSVEAMKAGKDVYCEKPLALTVREAQAIAEAARRYGRIFQVGSQQRSDNNFRFACELVRNGAIGKLKSVHVNCGGPAEECYLPAQSVPESLDWDLWLGPAPFRPYHADLAPQDNYAVFPNWRRYRDYCNGGLYDFGAHHFDIAQWGLGMDGSGPVKIFPPGHGDAKLLTFVYADGSPMTHGGASGRAAIEFVGESGTVRVNRGFLETDPADLIRHKWGAGDIRLYESLDHMANWLDGIRTRRPCICTAEIGLSTITVCSLASIAYRLNEPLAWDPKAMAFINNPAAGRLLARDLRAPWSIAV